MLPSPHGSTHPERTLSWADSQQDVEHNDELRQRQRLSNTLQKRRNPLTDADTHGAQCVLAT